MTMFTIQNQPITITNNKVKHGNNRPISTERFLGKLLKNQRRQLRTWAKLQGINMIPCVTVAETTTRSSAIAENKQESIPLKNVRELIQEWTQKQQNQPNNNGSKLRLHRLHSRKRSA